MRIVRAIVSLAAGCVFCVIMQACPPVYYPALRSTVTAPPQTDGSGGSYTSAASANGNYAYACTNGGLQVIDITDVFNATVVAVVTFPGSYEPEHVCVSGSTAYVTCGSYSDSWSGNTVTVSYSDALFSVDVTSINHPVIVGTIPAPSGKMLLNGSLLYICSAPLMVVDVSSPANMHEVNGAAGSVGSGVTANDIAIKGNYAYLADGPNGLDIFDLSVPSSPRAVGAIAAKSPSTTYPTGFGFQSCTIDGDSGLLFALDRNVNGSDITHYLRVFDVSDPKNPIEVETLQDTMMGAHDLVVYGDFAYFLGMLNSNSGITNEVWVAQVSPLGKSDSKYYPVAGATMTAFRLDELYLDGNRLFVPNGEYGLNIYEINQKYSSSRSIVGADIVLEKVIKFPE